MAQVVDLVEAWERAGSPACTHEKTAVEYYYQFPTGDIVCVGCGDAWPQNAATPPVRGNVFTT